MKETFSPTKLYFNFKVASINIKQSQVEVLKFTDIDCEY